MSGALLGTISKKYAAQVSSAAPSVCEADPASEPVTGGRGFVDSRRCLLKWCHHRGGGEGAGSGHRGEDQD